MEDNMNSQELVSVEIDNYCRLQRIRTNMPEGVTNDTLEYEIRISAAKLTSYGINLDNLIP